MGAALREAGIATKAHDTYFEQDCDDEVWIPDVARRGWIILSKDLAMRNRGPHPHAHREALIAAKAAAFLLRSASMSGPDMASLLVATSHRMLSLARTHTRPLIVLVSREGRFEKIIGERRGGGESSGATPDHVSYLRGPVEGFELGEDPARDRPLAGIGRGAARWRARLEPPRAPRGFVRSRLTFRYSVEPPGIDTPEGGYDDAVAGWSERSSPTQWWTRLQPIRTAAAVELDFAIFSQKPFRYQAIASDARRMHRLGLSLRAIGRILGLNEKTVAKALSAG